MPADTWRQADRFLDSSATADGGYSYTPNNSSTSSMTVVGLFCRHARGWKLDDPRLEKGLARFKQQAPEAAKRSGFFYQYFATLLMNQRGTEAAEWNAALWTDLLAQQEKAEEGRIGSWQSSQWHQFGRTFATPLAILMLRAADRIERLPPLPKRELKAAEVEALWNELKGADVFRATEATRRLGASAEQAVSFLTKRLEPAKVEAERIARLIGDLESGRFAVRKQAEHDLVEMGEVAEPALREALDAKPALDLKTRLNESWRACRNRRGKEYRPCERSRRWSTRTHHWPAKCWNGWRREKPRSRRRRQLAPRCGGLAADSTSFKRLDGPTLARGSPRTEATATARSGSFSSGSGRPASADHRAAATGRRSLPRPGPG